MRAIKWVIDQALGAIFGVLCGFVAVVLGLDSGEKMIADLFVAPPWWLAHPMFRTLLVVVGLTIIGLSVRSLVLKHVIKSPLELFVPIPNGEETIDIEPNGKIHTVHTCYIAARNNSPRSISGCTAKLLKLETSDGPYYGMDSTLYSMATKRTEFSLKSGERERLMLVVHKDGHLFFQGTAYGSVGTSVGGFSARDFKATVEIYSMDAPSYQAVFSVKADADGVSSVKRMSP